MRSFGQQHTPGRYHELGARRFVRANYTGKESDASSIFRINVLLTPKYVGREWAKDLRTSNSR